MSIPLVKGASYVLTGLRWLPKRGIRGFVAIPLLINSILFSIGIYWGADQLERLDLYMQSYLPGWLHWLHWLLWPLFLVTVLIVIFYTFTVFANVIASPFNSLLSERVEKMVAPAARSTTNTNIKDLILSPLTEVKKLLYFAGWVIPLLLLSFVPVVNVITPALWLVLGAWMLALEYADYPLGNHGIPFRKQRFLLRKNRLLVLGFGGMTLLLTLIPILNFLAMPSAVIGATLMWTREMPDAGQT